MISTLKIGDKVTVFNNEGSIKFIGQTKFSPGNWVGIELKEKVGRNDGSVQGIKYFECKPEHGIFSRPSQVKFLNPNKQNKDNYLPLKFPVSSHTKKLILGHKTFFQFLVEQRNSLVIKKRRLEKIHEQRNSKTKDEYPQKQRSKDKHKKRLIKILKKEKIKQLKKKQELEYIRNVLKQETLKKKQEVSGFRDSNHYLNLVKVIEEEVEKNKNKVNEQTIKQKEIERAKVNLQIEIKIMRAKVERELFEKKKILQNHADQVKRINKKKKKILKQFGYSDTFSFEKIKNSKEKIKKMKNDLIQMKKKIMDLKAGVSKHKIQVNSILKPNDKIDKSNWKNSVFKLHPEYSDFLDRIKPQRRAITFSHLYGATKNHISIQLKKEDIQQLIIQYFVSKRMNGTVEFLLKKIQKKQINFQPNRLKNLLTTALNETDKLFNIIIHTEENNNEIIKKEKLNNFEMVANDLGLKFKIQNDLNIWNQLEDDENNIQFLSPDLEINKKINFQNNFSENLFGATLNKLIERLSWEHATDSTFNKIILLTYQTFTKSEHFLSKLIQRYNVPQRIIKQNKKMWKQKKGIIQLRVLTIINAWIQSSTNVLDQKILCDIKAFLEKQVAKDYPQFANKINDTIKKKNEGIVINTAKVFKHPPPDVRIPKTLFTQYLKLSHLDYVEFGRQLTIYFHSLFRSIKSHEFLSQDWKKTDSNKKGNNIVYFIKKFNEFVQYSQEQMIGPKSIKSRSLKMVRYIKIAQYLLKIHNFDSLMAIIGAFSSPSVIRLQKTFNEVPKTYLKTLTEYQELMSFGTNFKRYRKNLNNTRLPIVPYLAVFLNDLSLVSESYENYIDNLINFQKRKQLYQIIQQINYYQQSRYNFYIITQVQQLFKKKLCQTTEKKLLKISLRREPINTHSKDELWKH
ncbi:guanine nucleotide exchange factor [Anaeramoeba flamelloides]|uniref:Guanine nucleotide exchange factor n=1 Tax=Anaeramoeba flamelloides TaxID=1746091 RepID=A0AAV7YKY8_9EUKA|nr:guanine nucleotide exchange factor [Anaeramoeba flamelloides]